jgi:hypothetical protein
MAAGDEYRARARECTDAADHAADPERRLSLLELAQRWLVLADQADEMERTRTARGDVLLAEKGSSPSPPLNHARPGSEHDAANCGDPP